MKAGLFVHADPDDKITCERNVREWSREEYFTLRISHDCSVFLSREQLHALEDACREARKVDWQALVTS